MEQFTEIHVDTHIDKYWIEVQHPYGRVRERNEGPQGDGNPIRRPKLSTNLEPRETPKTKPPTKEHIWAGPRPLAHMQKRPLISGLSEKGFT